jgi:DNA invertase Pin-like site-specific DNA recombinase
MNAQAKVTADHLRKQAILYVRQSTLHQVKENRESTALQYDLKRHAQELGWNDQQTVVIDEDLGHSGATATDRSGFQRLVAEVSLGRVGLVMGLSVSRLARNNADWHRLLEICALTGTLIVDEDGLYDPNHFNDRLVLGLKGTMSEAELYMLRARLIGGLLNKATRRAVGTCAHGLRLRREPKIRVPSRRADPGCGAGDERGEPGRENPPCHSSP